MKKIGDLIGGLIDEIGTPPEPPEGWEAHDRKVAEKLEIHLRTSRKTIRLSRIANLVALGVPLKDAAKVIDNNLKPTKALLAAREKLDGILVLSGPVGCGKTTAAAWWVTRPFYQPLIDMAKSRFMRAIEIERLSRFDGDDWARIEKARRLVIDDLGTEYLDKYGSFLSLIRGVIDARYNHCLPTMITTNMPAEDFVPRYGERLVDRLREVGSFVEIAEGSMRKG